MLALVAANITTIAATLASPATRTADLGGTSDTEGVTNAVIAALNAS
jgi:isocitrate/isopropylmalate dehydrogenase